MTRKDAGGGAVLPAAIAFLLWGGWAFHANLAASDGLPLVPALVQGSASAAITLLMAFAVQRLQLLLAPWPRVATWLPPFLIVAFTSALLVSFHSFAGTPKLAATIIPPSTLAFLFCLYLSLRLARANRALAKEVLS